MTEIMSMINKSLVKQDEKKVCKEKLIYKGRDLVFIKSLQGLKDFVQS